MEYLVVDVGGSSIKHAVMNERYEIVSQGTLGGVRDAVVIVVGTGLGCGISAAPAFGRTLASELGRIYESTYAQRLGLVAPKLVTCHHRNEANLMGALYHHFNGTGKE